VWWYLARNPEAEFKPGQKADRSVPPLAETNLGIAMQTRNRRLIKEAGIVGIVIVALFAINILIPIRRGYTAQYGTAGSIASLESVTLGETRQWILIRGASVSNPLLVFLHGGPGMPVMYLAHDFQSKLERDFTVVQWDRRGAGKSFDAGAASASLSVSQEISDTLELIDQLRTRFHQRKVYLVGFSYGSYLGILVAQRAPERLHAYVGIGQLACSEQQNREIQTSWIREQAVEHHNQVLLEQIDAKKPFDREKWLFEYGGEIHSAKTWWPLLWSGLRSSEYTFKDIGNVKRGVNYTARHLRYDAIHGSIIDNVSSLQVPVYFFSGQFDYTDPTPCTERLFNKIEAPVKRLVWFDGAAHFVFLEEPARFAAEMRRMMEDTKTFEQTHATIAQD
jgi:pimeloyl-ACP methyl ester carboxylesterase